MKTVSLQISSGFSKSFYRLATLALIATAGFSFTQIVGQRSAIAQTAEVVDQADDLIDNKRLNEESDELEPADLSRILDSDAPSSDTISSSERKFTSTHFVQISIITIVILWGYSLVMSGKLGVGWMVLSVILGVFGYFGGMIKSLFQEVTSSNEVGDWEDE